MIRIEGVSHRLSTPNGMLTALKDVNLTIERGEAVALMGANGSGKSTLCRCVNGLLVPEAGSVTVDGANTREAASAGRVKRLAGMVFQDPSRQLVTWSVEEEIAFGLENLRLPPSEITSVVRRSLKEWDLEGLKGRHPLRLSSGQMARVAIAAVLAMRPAYLVVDEPTSLLDSEGRAALLRAISEIRERGDVGLLWVTQFPQEVGPFDRLVVMREGHVVADGRPEVVLGDAGRSLSCGLASPAATTLASALRRRGIGVSEGIFLVEKLLEELESLGVNRSPQLEAGNDPGEEKEGRPGLRPPALKMSGVWCGYPGGDAVLKNVSAEVPVGEGLGIVGRSGSGKSTFLFAASGALGPARGSVVRGRGEVEPGGVTRRTGTTGGTHSREAARGRGPATEGVGPGIGLAVQLPEEGFCAPTVTEEIAVGLRGRGLDGRGLREKVERSLEMVGLDCGDIGMRSPLSLSEGEKKKVALASAIAAEGALLLLDEPTQGLDGLSAGLVLRAVRAHLDHGGTAVVVSHDWDFLLCVADRMIALRDGGVTESAPRRGVLLSEEPSELLPGGQLAAIARWAGCWPERRFLDTLEDAAERLSEQVAAALNPRLPSATLLKSR